MIFSNLMVVSLLIYVQPPCKIFFPIYIINYIFKSFESFMFVNDTKLIYNWTIFYFWS